MKITSECLPIKGENIDTDQIFPARFLKTTKKEGLGKYLFYDWRFDKNGKLKAQSLFDKSIYRETKILVAGNNFGCGSSREHAVWAILDFGFKAVISSSFGDIFYNNALKNGLLPIVLEPIELEKLFQVIGKNPQTKVTVDLEKQEVFFNPSFWGAPIKSGRLQNQAEDSGQARMTNGAISFHFPIDPFRKTCLLKGIDELGYIMSLKNKIKDFERKHKIYISN